VDRRARTSNVVTRCRRNARIPRRRDTATDFLTRILADTSDTRD